MELKLCRCSLMVLLGPSPDLFSFKSHLKFKPRAIVLSSLVFILFLIFVNKQWWFCFCFLADSGGSS